MMEVDDDQQNGGADGGGAAGAEEDDDWPGRWNHVRKLLERRGPFTHPSFEPSPNTLKFLRSTCKLLVIGAGGLGCELLKAQ